MIDIVKHNTYIFPIINGYRKNMNDLVTDVKSLELETIISLNLTYKYLGKEYDEKAIHSLIKEAENIDFETHYRLYQLLEDKSYLKTSFNQVKENTEVMGEKLKAKFLSYPIPKAIIEEWEKVK